MFTHKVIDVHNNDKIVYVGSELECDEYAELLNRHYQADNYRVETFV